MSGVTKTVIVLAGVNGKHERLRAALERTQVVADIARKHGNQVHYAFLGGALPPHGEIDEAVLEWMVALKEGSRDFKIDGANVHLIAGPREIQALSLVASGKHTAALKRYFEHSKLVECLGSEGMDAYGSNGIWLKCTSTHGGAIVGKLPGVGVMGANGPRAEWIDSPTTLTSIAWKDELNKRWLAAVADPAKLRDQQPAKWQFWMTIGVQSALDQEPFPAAGLGMEVRGSTAVFAHPSSTFGTVRRTILASEDNGEKRFSTAESWMDIGVNNDSLYWAVQTWCFATMRSMNAHTLPLLDLTPDLSELQYDVSCTLSSLVQHSERANALTPPVHPWADFGKLRGELGPCVISGREDGEVLRLVHWTGVGMPDAIMLLPEAYLRFVFSDYNSDLTTSVGMEGARAVSGFIVLNDNDIIPMRLPELSEAEQAHASTVLGSRLWKVSLRSSNTAIAKAIAAATPPWRQLLTYNVVGLQNPLGVTPGQRVPVGAGWQMFYTHCTTADPLSGLRVKWVFAPGEQANARDMPTLDVA